MQKTKKDWNHKNKKNTINLAFWTISWTASMALSTFGRMFIWHDNKTLSIAAILINLLLGIGMILANIRFIKGLDELQQKIQLEAMSIALGVGVIGGLFYSQLDQANIITSNAEISHLVILIALTYMVGIFIGRVRYK